MIQDHKNRFHSYGSIVSKMECFVFFAGQELIRSVLVTNWTNNAFVFISDQQQDQSAFSQAITLE